MCDLTISDETLAEKFKREYSEQFHILVRMHLSFLLDLNTDENECFSDKSKLKKWSLVPFNKKSKANKNVMEGAPLTQEGICQVYQLIEFLKKEQNIKIEGVFRRTGSLTRQQELKSLLSQGLTLELEGSSYSVHDCASVLKGFLAELPDPLLTEAHYPAYCQIAELCGVKDQTAQNEKLLVALQLLLLLLPTENKVLLKDILDLLHFTASFEGSNRMSADNLAKLFTPHLLCPRKLTPEQLHITSQTLSGIVSFMINHTSELFKIPQKLIVDFRARYEKRKLLSANNKCMNESINDQFAANTVYTFVDHERTAKENETNTTETALAQLYAHIQSLPESSKKRKLVKQFNKENGHGTPLQVLRSGVQKNKSFGDSIKKHIFHKNVAKSLKKVQMKLNANEETAVSTPTNSSHVRFFCNNCNSSNDESNNDESAPKRRRKSKSDEKVRDESVEGDSIGSTPRSSYLTSTPACVALHSHQNLGFTPDEQDRKSMSPITRSTQRMTRAMQETMMTPRSRKPVLLVSGTNINALGKAEPVGGTMDNVIEEEFAKEHSTTDKKSPEKPETPKTVNETENDAITSTFREYLERRSMLTTSSPAVDSSFSSRTDDFTSNEFNDFSQSKMTQSLIDCLDGNDPETNDDAKSSDEESSKSSSSSGEKKLVLKPKQFDENGQAIVFETSF